MVIKPGNYYRCKGHKDIFEIVEIRFDVRVEYKGKWDAVIMYKHIGPHACVTFVKSITEFKEKFISC